MTREISEGDGHRFVVSRHADENQQTLGLADVASDESKLEHRARFSVAKYALSASDVVPLTHEVE